MLLFILYLAFVRPAEAHLAHEGTSDGSDAGETIQLYKVAPTHFRGRFMRAREAWSRVPSAPKLEMVRDMDRAEVLVYAYTDPACRGEMWKFTDPTLDTLMITTGCGADLPSLERVALHELGHVLDLEHHPCGSLASVMSECAGVAKITLHDRLSLKSLDQY